MDGLFWIIFVGSKCDHTVREVEEDLTTVEECEDESGGRGGESQWTKEWGQPLETEKQKDCFSLLPEYCSAKTLILILWNWFWTCDLRTVRE